MNLQSLDSIPKLHTTPLAVVRIENACVIVDADDCQEQRIRFVFKPYQAMRMTTADCFAMPPDSFIKPGLICEVKDSDWIAQLKRNLKKVDEIADFLDKARHYLVPLQDDFLEVVAWDITSKSQVEVTK